MGIKESILAYIAQLETVQVTNGDGNTVPMYVAIWNNQIERKKDGTGYDYGTPASFLEVQFGEGTTVGMGVTSYELTVRIMVEHQHYNTEDTLDQDLIIFDLKDKVHRVMNMFKAPNCSPLCASNPAMDYNHDNTYLCVLEYRTHFIDYTGSMLDVNGGVYVEDTLTNPTLQTVVIVQDLAILDPAPKPIYGIGIFDCITSVILTPIGPGVMQVNFASAIFINNTGSGPNLTYTIDWGDGTNSSIEVGDIVNHTYLASHTYTIAVRSNYNSFVTLEASTDASNQFSCYMPYFNQSFNYDLWQGYDPNYPVQITTDTAITKQTVNNYSIQDGSILLFHSVPVFPEANGVILQSTGNNTFSVKYHTVANNLNLEAQTILNLIPTEV